DRLGVGGVEHVDGGGYVVEFVVYRTYVERENTNPGFVQRLLFDPAELAFCVEPEEPITSFQFQADMEGAAVIGQRAPDCLAEEVLEALAAALLAAPAELLSRELAVRDPEWELDPEMYTPRPEEGSLNWYGWDGTQFLGKENIR